MQKVLTMGLMRRPAATAQEHAETRRFCGAPTPLETVLQPIGFIRNQQSKPSCVGQSLAACIDSKLGKGPWCSAVDLWIDARRRQGDLDNDLVGTRADYAIDSLVQRGWSIRDEDEDSRDGKLDRKMPSLMAELRAHDRRMGGARHFYVVGERKRQVVAALHAGFGVVFGTGVKPGYIFAPAGKILDSRYLGGETDGHEQRIRGYDAERDSFIVQNSWGTGWCGCSLNGEELPGCALVTPEVIEEAWDVDVLEILL